MRDKEEHNANVQKNKFSNDGYDEKYSYDHHYYNKLNNMMTDMKTKKKKFSTSNNFSHIVNNKNGNTYTKHNYNNKDEYISGHDIKYNNYGDKYMRDRYDSNTTYNNNNINSNNIYNQTYQCNNYNDMCYNNVTDVEHTNNIKNNDNDNYHHYDDDEIFECLNDDHVNDPINVDSLNEEEKKMLEKIFNDCEEWQDITILNNMKECILNMCNYNFNSCKIISLLFYNRILKCVIFKNKMNLIHSYDELLKYLILNNKMNILKEFKKYINLIIQDAYTCAYYKDKNIINHLLQMVYKWKKLLINDIQETKELLNIFHYDNSTNENIKNYDHPLYNYNNYHLYTNHHKHMNNKIPPPPSGPPPNNIKYNNINPKSFAPPPPPPDNLQKFNVNDSFKGLSSYDNNNNNNNNRLEHVDDFKHNFNFDINHSMSYKDTWKNPENITVGFLATILKVISKKGKKLQNPLIPYTPIDTFYAYQTPPSVNISHKMNEKIEEFYDELSFILNNEEIQSSDISDTNDINDIYERYKKLTGENKKGKKKRKNSTCTDDNNNINNIDNIDNNNNNNNNNNNDDENNIYGNNLLMERDLSKELCDKQNIINDNNLECEKKNEHDFSSDTNTTFSSIEILDDNMLDLLVDTNKIYKNKKNKKKSKNVNFNQIAIENAQNWSETQNYNSLTHMDFYSLGNNTNDVFENYRRNKAYVYHETIAQKFYDLKFKDTQ
ncbi:conserved Plasmodium protein, unknown function [Plasmodium sp. gorilla clade G2]|uniref:conserved Plasmodium protein, unknown function n=1 Tax=Plasmodium sp. gorilla clade G2 TaxID=880535 RepID=UPI000D21B37C|nr:conserved Plasmodium protein, unknown function [Plasmodium sp. gorilla clade G2]SOV10607.1 conserved Plasmodium protein, unknown function [Plasmodium sp. gorilla clade G2]